MSDPVTNVAIEDVLSSIRRLVSEDARIRPMAAPDAPEVPVHVADAQTTAPQDAYVPGRLVLTPALRVDDAPTDDIPDGNSELAPDSQPQPHDVAPEMQALDAPEPEPEAVLTDWQDEVLSADHTDTVAAADSSDAEMPETMAEPEVMAWEDHHEQDLPGITPPDLMIETAADDDVADSTDWDHAPEPDHEVDDAHDHDAPAVSEDAPPAGDFVFASTRDGAVPQEDVFAAADPDQQQDDRDTDHASLFSEDDTFLDEDALRELVTEIVRQELQGALGERITRNVRKLVRREIHRALTSQELE